MTSWSRSAACTPNCTASSTNPSHPPWPHPHEAPTMSHQLIVLPDDTAKPILDAINASKSALNIRMFLFTDETLLQAVIAAKQRGVNVRVMLNPARRKIG